MSASQPASKERISDERLASLIKCENLHAAWLALLELQERRASDEPRGDRCTCPCHARKDDLCEQCCSGPYPSHEPSARHSESVLEVGSYRPLNFNGLLSDFNRLETGEPFLTVAQRGGQEINLGAAEASAVYEWLGHVLGRTGLPPGEKYRFKVGDKVAWTGVAKCERTGVVKIVAEPRYAVEVDDGLSSRPFHLTFDESDLRPYSTATKGADAP